MYRLRHKEKTKKLYAKHPFSYCPSSLISRKKLNSRGVLAVVQLLTWLRQIRRPFLAPGVKQSSRLKSAVILPHFNGQPVGVSAWPVWNRRPATIALRTKSLFFSELGTRLFDNSLRALPVKARGHRKGRRADRRGQSARCAFSRRPEYLLLCSGPLVPASALAGAEAYPRSRSRSRPPSSSLRERPSRPGSDSNLSRMASLSALARR